jgi:uncharacterized protein YbjT (DUF2867 family)
MKVLVIGANGQIGQHLIRLLSGSDDHTLRAMVRSKEQAVSFEGKEIETVIANLEGSVKELADAARGCEAVVFTAGSGGKTGADKTLLVDLDGAAKTVEAAKQAGIRRFIMVSALQAHRRENWNDKIRHYYAAKHYADKIVEDSGLTYTIIRPGGLLNEQGTGKILAAENLDRASIPREDVASTILECLNEERTFNRSFDLVSGNSPISDALKAL